MLGRKLVDKALVSSPQEMWPFFRFPKIGLLDQPSHLLTVVSSRIAWVFTGLGLMELKYLIYPRLSTVFRMRVLFTNLSLMEFQVKCLIFFHLFLVLDGLEWF